MIAALDRPAASAGPVSRIEARWLVAILGVAVAVRVLALLVLDEALYSDAGAYMEMARTMLAAPVMRDIYGNAALYSPGYPLVMSAAFALFGVDPAVARGLNLVLGLATVALTWAVGRRATGRPAVGLIAAAGMAVLIPAVAGTEMLERENLCAPLLLLFVWLTLGMPTARRPARTAAIAGVAFGCGLLAGVSMLFTAVAFVAAIVTRRPGWARGTALMLAFAGAALLVVTPYVMRNERVLGYPVLSTNAGINLYVGNNPFADGRFVSIADTPLGPYWKTFRKLNSEARQSQELTAMALAHVQAEPWKTAVLDLHKLAYFWLPDLPDREDSDLGPGIRAVRWMGVAQHLMVLALVGMAAFRWRRWTSGPWLIVLAVCGFWAIHGIVYVIPRYRAPAMPLMLVLAALPLADLLAQGGRRGRVPAAAIPDG